MATQPVVEQLKARALEAANDSKRARRLDLSAKFAEVAASYTLAAEVAALRFALADLATAAERASRDVPRSIEAVRQISDTLNGNLIVLVFAIFGAAATVAAALIFAK